MQHVIHSHKSLLIIGAGILQAYFIKEAKSLGLYVIATDGDCNALGFADADECHVLDTYNWKGHALFASELRDSHPCKLIGVATCGSDTAHSVAAAAEIAGLRGIPLKVAHLTHNKGAVREALSYADVDCYQPRYLIAMSYCSTNYRAIVIEERCILGGFPIVVKPLEQRASRGISIVQNKVQFHEAVTKVLPYGEEYLLEECLVGTEHSVEGIFGEAGELIWFNIVDRIFTYENGLALEIGHVNPTKLDTHVQQQMLLMFLAAARALDVSWGAFKIDAILTADGPKILEVTARLSGGFESQVTSPMTGRHPMRALLQLSCGMEIDVQKNIKDAEGYAACCGIFARKQGVLQALPLWEENDEEFCGGVWCCKSGDTIGPAQHCAERLGFVFAYASNYGEAWLKARREAELLEGLIVELTDSGGADGI